MKPAFWLEALAYLALVALLTRQAGLMRPWRSLAWPRRLLLAALLCAPLVGQVIHHDDWTYPWVGWAMYTDPVPGDVTYLEYSAVLDSGREVDWPVARLFSRIGKKAVWKLKALDRAGKTHTSDVILDELARRYNRTHTDDPARRIRVWECTVPIDRRREGAALRRTLVREVPLAEAAAQP